MFPLLSFLKCIPIKYINNKRLFRFFCYCMRINSSLADINVGIFRKKTSDFIFICLIYLLLKFKNKKATQIIWWLFYLMLEEFSSLQSNLLYSKVCPYHRLLANKHQHQNHLVPRHIPNELQERLHYCHRYLYQKLGNRKVSHQNL